MSDFQFKEQQSSPIGISQDVADIESAPAFRTTTTLPTRSPSTINTSALPTLIRKDAAATYPTQPHDKIEILDVNESPTSSSTSEGVSLWLGAGGATPTLYTGGSDGVADVDEGGSADGVSLGLDSMSGTADDEPLLDTTTDEQDPAPPPTEIDEMVESQTTDETPTTTSASTLSDYLPWVLGATGIGASIFIAYRMLQKP